MASDKIHVISKSLASHYKGESCGACACLGIECYNPSDARWWVNFLTLFKPDDVKKMTEMYIIATGYPQWTGEWWIEDGND